MLSGENILPSPYTPAWTRPYCSPSWGWTGRLELQGPTPARSSTGTTPASADVPPEKEHICKICKRTMPVKFCKFCKNPTMRVEIRQTGIFSASSSVFTIHWHHDLHHCLYLSNLSPAFDHDKLVELLLVDSLEPPLSSQQRLHNNWLWNKQQHSYKIFKNSKVYILDFNGFNKFNVKKSPWQHRRRSSPRQSHWSTSPCCSQGREPGHVKSL